MRPQETGGAYMRRLLPTFVCALLITVITLACVQTVDTLGLGRWVYVSSTPTTGGYGEAVAYDGRYIYIIRCRTVNDIVHFWRFDPLTKTWTSLSTPTVNGEDKGIFRTGTALAWDYGNYIYALVGARYEDPDRRIFLRYSIEEDAWERLPDTPGAQGAGDAICWSGYDNKVYVLLGNRKRDPIFACYDPVNGTWTIKASPPGRVDDGAALVWCGGKYLYALQGECYESSPNRSFWRYDLENDKWDIMAPIPDPGGVGDGASLLWIGYFDESQRDYIYALGGGSYDEDPGYGFYRYIISNNTWEILEDILYPVGYYVGNRLGYACGAIFYWQGGLGTWPGSGNSICAFIFEGVDVFPPECSIVEPRDGSYLRGTVEVEVEAEDDTGINFVVFYLDGKTMYMDLVPPYGWTWNTTECEDGVHTISVIACDVSGKCTVDSIEVIVDNTAPVVRFLSPVEGSIVEANVSIVFSVEEENLDYVSLYIDDQLKETWSEPGEKTYLWNTFEYDDGEHILKIEALDKAGNVNVAELQVFVNNLPPEVSIDYPVEGSYLAGLVTISVSAWDAVGVSKVEFYILPALVYVCEEPPYTFQWDTSSCPDGVYTIKVVAYDLTGKYTAYAVEVTVDNTPPTLEILNPRNGECVHGTYTVEVRVYDRNIDSIELWVDDTIIERGETGYFTWDTTKFSDGIHRVKILAYDKAGNINLRQVLVIVDNTPPEIKAVSCSSGDPIGKQLAIVIAEVIDETSGVSKVILNYRINEGEWVSVEMKLQNRIWKAVIPASSGSRIDFYIVAVDKANNEASSGIQSYTLRNAIVIGCALDIATILFVTLLIAIVASVLTLMIKSRRR